MKNQGKNEENYEKTKGYSLEAFGASLLDEFEQQPKKNIDRKLCIVEVGHTHTISYSVIHIWMFSIENIYDDEMFFVH